MSGNYRYLAVQITEPHLPDFLFSFLDIIGLLIISSILILFQRPNFLWHIDGYDELKPYGFAIHGCIDG